MRKGTAALLLYIAVMITITLVNHPWILGAGLVALLAAAGRHAPRLARKALLAILLFNSVVTVSYVVVAVVRGAFSPGFVVLVNLRVFLLTFLTFFTFSRINVFEALSFSKSLSYVLTLAASQTVAFRRLFEDFRMAFKSRTARRADARDLYRHGAAAASFFLQKSYQESTEIGEAMRSRGFFDD
ncbi:MAG: ABC transporter permease [bacterium]